MESAASGLVAGINAARAALGTEEKIFDPRTALGALAAYICNDTIKNFQPMNINFGLIPPLDVKIKSKKDRYEAISQRSLKILENF